MSRSQRPPRTYVTDPVTRAVRVLGLVAIAAVAAWLLLRYPALPQTVPTHFGPDGQADAWGDKSSVLLLVPLMVALGALIAWASTKPRWFNLPVPVTEQNAQRLYREGERMLVWMLPAIALLFAGIAMSTVGLAGGPLAWIGVAAMVVAMLIGLVRTFRAA